MKKMGCGIARFDMLLDLIPYQFCTNIEFLLTRLTILVEDRPKCLERAGESATNCDCQSVLATSKPNRSS
jgi:hypothetical protein